MNVIQCCKSDSELLKRKERLGYKSCKKKYYEYDNKNK